MSSVVGSVAGIALVVRGRAKLGGFTAVPYGPFLALGALVWMYWGPTIFDWYLRLLRLNG
jgi:leader peptidase (prepilin peptidase)/N-methyltransferase